MSNSKKIPLKEHYRRSRRAVLAALGGKCVRCGFLDERALQIDHVNGGGLAELRSRTWLAHHLAVIADRTGAYQLLCANCNWIKRAEQNENPGQRKAA